MEDEYRLEDLCAVCAGKSDRVQHDDVWHLAADCYVCDDVIIKCDADFYDEQWHCPACGSIVFFADVDADGVPVFDDED